MTSLAHRALLAAFLLCPLARDAEAQAPSDSLRILRLSPADSANPLDSIVVAFDHPVAPRLDESVDPDRVVHITPRLRHRAAWRDPSTLVIAPLERLAFGAEYRVVVEPSLRSADGVRLAKRQEGVVRVRRARVLAVWPTMRADGQPATLQRPRVLYEEPIALSALAGRGWIAGCSAPDSIPLVPESIERPSPEDLRRLRADGVARGAAMDSLQRVVRYVAGRELARGCRTLMHLPVAATHRGEHVELLLVAPEFRLDSLRLAPDAGLAGTGSVGLYFDLPVPKREVMRAVTIDGRQVAARRSAFASYGSPSDTLSTYWELAGVVPAGRTVRLSIRADLENATGERLGAEIDRTFSRPHAAGGVELPGGSMIVPADGGNLLVVQHVNTDSLRVVISRVPHSLRASMLQLRGGYNTERPNWYDSGTVVRTVPSRTPQDGVLSSVLPASLVPREWRHEVLAIRVGPPDTPTPAPLVRMPRPAPDPAVVQITNLAAHATSYGGATEVWVTSLRTALPIANARVRVLDESGAELATATTDGRGRAHLDYAERVDATTQPLLEAQAGDDRVFVPLARSHSQPYVDEEDLPHYYHRDGPQTIAGGRQLLGTAFPDRGIYRPGERVHLKGIVRTFRPRTSYVTPAGDSVRWTIRWFGENRYARDAERVQRRTGTLSAFGTSADSFDIARTAPLGAYSALLSYRTPRGWRVAAEAQFDVGEYRANEFELALTADTAAKLFAGDTVRIQAAARYLFGAPMQDARIMWNSFTMPVEPWRLRVPGLDGFVVGRSWWRLPAEQIAAGMWSVPDSTRSDASGSATITVPVQRVPTMATMSVSITATDANRRTVTSRRELTVHAADAYVGLRTRTRLWSWSAGEPIAVELVTVNASGTRHDGLDVALRALRYEWRDGRWQPDTVWRSATRSAREPVAVEFRPASPGWYELLATVRDDRGRTSQSGLELWVTGPRGASDTTSKLLVQLDRRRYSVGDTVTAIVQSPYEQRAWVMLTRGVPLDERVVTLKPGANVVRFPIPEAAIPAAELRVLTVRPLDTKGGDQRVAYSTESAIAEVGTAPRALAVQVRTDRASYAPRDTVRVAVAVRDASGRPRRAELTLWAVDEGVGMLTGLEKPDILGSLLGGSVITPWEGSSLSVPVLDLSPGSWSRSIRIRIRGMSTLSGRIPSMPLEAVVSTAYGEQRMIAARRIFATTPLYAASVLTDASGTATLPFVLPDNVTRFRVFATAVSNGIEAGSGDTTLTATRPLIVRAALPRAVRLGDTLLAGGVLTQSADGHTPVSLSVETRGIAVAGATTKRDTLHARRAAELRFPMHVVSGDSVMVRLRAQSARDGDAVELTLPVSPAGHLRAHVVSGSLEQRAEVELPAVDGIDVSRSHVMVQLGTSLVPVVRQVSDVLRVYPYDCTEQLSSIARALLARVTLERALDSTATLRAADRAQLERIVAQIAARQQQEGAFGYWRADGWTSPWLSAYATEALLDARAEGIEVSTGVLERAKAHLTNEATALSAAGWGIRSRDQYAALAVARALRRLGAPHAELERGLADGASRLGFVPRLELAQLRAAAGDNAAARALLASAWHAVQRSGRKVVLDDSTHASGWIFDSRLWPMARLLQATAALEPHHPLLGALLESVVQARRAEHGWQWNTLDQSAVAEALAATRSVYRFGEAREVRIDAASGSLAVSRFVSGGTDSLDFALARVLGAARDDSVPRLTLASQSNAPVYYAATLFETPRARPVRADDEGISVERWYESWDGRKPAVSVREGALVRVRLRITVKGDRDFVAVEDPLPAGLEAVDVSLKTAGLEPSEDDAAARARRDAGWWSWYAWDHSEMRDDRVLYFARTLRRGSYEIEYAARATTAGTFVRPPAHAEEMYNPAVHGRSDGGWFTVAVKP